MGKNSADLQDIILNGVRKNRIPVTMHLTNGVPLKGISAASTPTWCS